MLSRNKYPVTLSFTIHYQNRSYSHLTVLVIVKKAPPAPAVTDLFMMEAFILDRCRRAESYAVYVDGALVKIVENSFVDLDTVIDSDGRYTIGIKLTLRFLLSLIVEIPYQQIPSHVEYTGILILHGRKCFENGIKRIDNRNPPPASYASLRQHLQYTELP